MESVFSYLIAPLRYARATFEYFISAIEDRFSLSRQYAAGIVSFFVTLCLVGNVCLVAVLFDMKQRATRPESVRSQTVVVAGSAPIFVAPPPLPPSPPPIPPRVHPTLDYDYVLGETFRLGDFSYRVLSTEFRETVGNSAFRARATPGATFLVVRYVETNEGRESVVGLAGTADLIDAEGRRFRVSTDASTALGLSGRADLWTTQLHPGVSHTTSVVFEVPSSEAERRDVLVLNQRGAFNSGSARVLLRNSLDVMMGRSHSEILWPLVLMVRKGPDENIRSLADPTEVDAFTPERVSRIAGAFRYMDTLVHGVPEGGFIIHYDGAGSTSELFHYVIRPSIAQQPVGDTQFVFTMRLRDRRLYLVDMERTPVPPPPTKARRRRR